MNKSSVSKKPISKGARVPDIKTHELLPAAIPTKRLELYFSIVVATIGFLLYFNTVFNDYALDDRAVIQENKFTKQGIAGIPTLLTTFYWAGFWGDNAGLYRPLSMVTFAVEWQFFPNNPHVGHVTNILLYALTGFLLFRMVRRMMPKHNILLPFIVSLLFIAHPIHTEVVANIKSRDEILCLLFFILAIDNLLMFADSGSKWKLVAAVGSYFLCLFAKESGVAFILIFPIILWFFRDLNVKAILSQSWPLVATVAFYFIIRILVLGTNVTGKAYTYLDNSLVAAPDLMTRLATAFYMLGKYLKLLVIPYPLSYDYSFQEIPFYNWSNLQALLPLLIYAAIFIYSIRCFLKNDKSIFAFGILFYLLSLAVVANVFILIGATMADRFLYIPSLGFCFIVAFGLMNLFPENVGKNAKLNTKSLFNRNKWALLLTVVILIPYSVETIARNHDWYDNKTLFVADAHSAKGSSRVRTNYGVVMLQKFDKTSPEKEKNIAYLDKSIVEFMASIKIDPKHPFAYLNLGGALYFKGEYSEAIEALITAIKLDPTDPKAYSTIGNAYYRTHDYQNSIINLKKCIELNFTSSETYNFLGGSYFATGDFPNAVAAYIKAIELDSKNVELHTNLGSVYGAKGDLANAISCFRKADELKPDNPQILSLLAMTYKKMGNTDSASFYNSRIAQIQQK
ncbi:MAG: tetratricopeptide repeat protein [Bacteroidales bacterium]